jgi:hypothetical protein
MLARLRLSHFAPVGIGVEAGVTNCDLALVRDMGGEAGEELGQQAVLKLSQMMKLAFGVFPSFGHQEVGMGMLCEAIYYVKLNTIFLVKPSEIIKLAAIMSSRTSHNQGDPTWGCELSV